MLLSHEVALNVDVLSRCDAGTARIGNKRKNRHRGKVESRSEMLGFVCLSGAVGRRARGKVNYRPRTCLHHQNARTLSRCPARGVPVDVGEDQMRALWELESNLVLGRVRL